MIGKEYLRYFAEHGINVVENTKMGWAEVEGPGGKKFWVSEKPPLNPAMMTDLYQFTMMAAYIESGKAEEIGTFNGFYRKPPFGGGFTITAGLHDAIDYLEQLQFTGRDIDHMRKKWKMPNSFYEYVREAKFDGTVEAIPEGTMAQPYEPIIQVTGPLPMANFVETALLNKIGFPTLVATKSARIYLQGKEPFIEFGARRAQGGIEGSLMASRSSYVGGATGTSNVASEMIDGIPATGTHAHSFVEAFPTQKEAFMAYAKVFGENSIFLIDTYGYESGTRDAVEVAKELGLKTFRGGRDDSGDFSYQSRIFRKILVENGFPDPKYVVSNDIDEYTRRSLREQGALIDLFGIGTKLVTADGSPSLGIVYKLVQVGDRHTIKISGNQEKMTDPARKKVYRFLDENGKYSGDVMALHDQTIGNEITAYHRSKGYESKRFSGNSIPLLVPVFVNGSNIYKKPHLDDIRQRALGELERMWPEMKRLENPAEYMVGLSPELKEIKDKLIQTYIIKK